MALGVTCIFNSSSKPLTIHEARLFYPCDHSSTFAFSFPPFLQNLSIFSGELTFCLYIWLQTDSHFRTQFRSRVEYWFCVKYCFAAFRVRVTTLQTVSCRCFQFYKRHFMFRTYLLIGIYSCFRYSHISPLPVSLYLQDHIYPVYSKPYRFRMYNIRQICINVIKLAPRDHEALYPTRNDVTTWEEKV